MSTGKRTRAAADFLQHATKKVKVDAPMSGDAAVLPAVSESLSTLHALIYPTGKKATSELTEFQRRVYAITKRIPEGEPYSSDSAGPPPSRSPEGGGSTARARDGDWS